MIKTEKIKLMIVKILPKPLLKLAISIYRLPFWLSFIIRDIPEMPFSQRLSLAIRFDRISRNVTCPHTEEQVITFVRDFLSIPPDQKGCVVEAGSFKGGSTSKFSIGAKMGKRQLLIFDSFEGLPDNEEPHERSILGHSIKGWFSQGKFCGSLEEVKSNIEKYGEIAVCTFIKGWFEDTMPNLRRRIAAAYVDVDLASSTRTCIKYLWPLIIPGGVLYSQDGDFPLVIEVLSSDEFWETEVGCKKPFIEGLGKDKLIKIVKLN